jgi:hypothetical protein
MNRIDSPSSITDIGVIAQEVPSRLSKNGKSVSSYGLDMLNLSAVKELYSLIDAQNARIDALEARIAILEGN